MGKPSAPRRHGQEASPAQHCFCSWVFGYHTGSNECGRIAHRQQSKPASRPFNVRQRHCSSYQDCRSSGLGRGIQTRRRRTRRRFAASPQPIPYSINALVANRPLFPASGARPPGRQPTVLPSMCFAGKLRTVCSSTRSSRTKTDASSRQRRGLHLALRRRDVRLHVSCHRRRRRRSETPRRDQSGGTPAGSHALALGSKAAQIGLYEHTVVTNVEQGIDRVMAIEI